MKLRNLSLNPRYSIATFLFASFLRSVRFFGRHSPVFPFQLLTTATVGGFTTCPTECSVPGVHRVATLRYPLSILFRTYTPYLSCVYKNVSRYIVFPSKKSEFSSGSCLTSAQIVRPSRQPTCLNPFARFAAERRQTTGEKRGNAYFPRDRAAYASTRTHRKLCVSRSTTPCGSHRDALCRLATHREAMGDRLLINGTDYVIQGHGRTPILATNYHTATEPLCLCFFMFYFILFSAFLSLFLSLSLYACPLIFDFPRKRELVRCLSWLCSCATARVKMFCFPRFFVFCPLDRVLFCFFYTNNAKPGRGEAFLSSEDGCGDGRLKREFFLVSLFGTRSSVLT